jgi:peptidoglycan/xylan/chitin deacetylase (PgdA/CDA1 family)
MPLAELLLFCRTREPLPIGAVAITFDDGYASNFHLAFPILREFSLPATIFLTTAFLDGEDRLWFQRVDRALRGGSSEQLAAKLAELKALSDPEMRRQVEQLDSLEAAKAHRSEDLPTVMRPMSWDQAREMRDSGSITFGGHTHTHPILARCTLEHQQREIETCRDRIKAELGAPPRIFAFPNGGADDYTADTLAILRRAGFDLALTMVSGRVGLNSRILELPRYGSPTSALETEATVSGAFELSKAWRQRGLRALGGLK